MELPALVRGRGEASSEQVLFVLAQRSNPCEFLEHPRGFFFHSRKIPSPANPVEPVLSRRYFSLFTSLV